MGSRSVTRLSLSVYTSRAEINNRVRFRQATPGSFDNLNLKLPVASCPFSRSSGSRVLAMTSSKANGRHDSRCTRFDTVWVVVLMNHMPRPPAVRVKCSKGPKRTQYEFAWASRAEPRLSSHLQFSRHCIEHVVASVRSRCFQATRIGFPF